MRKSLSVVILLICAIFILSPVDLLSNEGEGVVVDSSGGKRSELVDVKANIVYPYKINDSTSVLCLVGEFAAQHNGAVITADSAVRYENEQIECFGNVLINQNTTYAYCDRAFYNSDTSEALLYAPLVKVIDEDVTMYAYNFKFNTKSNIGEYWGNGVSVRQYEELNDEGVMEQHEQVMESERGYYYANIKRVIGVTRVELSGDDYEMQSDSTIYDMQQDQAFFFEHTNIWSVDGEYLYGDLGDYDKEKQRFRVEKNGYLLTSEQEGWADSMDYYRSSKSAIMRSNIQLDDTTHKSSAFADFANYWGNEDRVLLTRNPVVLNYDGEVQGGDNPQSRDSLSGEPAPVDTLFLKADTIIMVTKRFEFADQPQRDSLPTATTPNREIESDRKIVQSDSLSDNSVEPLEEQPISADSLSAENGDKKVKTPKVKRVKDTSAKDQKRAEKLEEQEQRRALQLQAEQVREFRRLNKRADKIQKKMDKRLAKGRDIYSDSMRLLDIRETLSLLKDSIDGIVVQKADSMIVADSLLTDSLVAQSVDSTYRLVRAFRSVRGYRSDIQFICDSLSGNTADSLMQLYFDPVVWSEKNQIVSEQMDLYMYNGELDFAHFIGDPIMSSEVIEGDTIHYNQIKGKDMYTYFEDNEVVRNDVEGNVQTIYFMQDEVTQEPTTYAYIESGTATFLVENRELDGMIYRAKPVYTFAPLDKIPIDKSIYLDDFKWRISEQPTRESVFDRVIRPTQRERVSSLPTPSFPIRKKINGYRKQLVKSGKWRDRDEHVSVAATEWMKSLGFTPGEPRKEGDGLF